MFYRVVNIACASFTGVIIVGRDKADVCSTGVCGTEGLLCSTGVCGTEGLLRSTGVGGTEDLLCSMGVGGTEGLLRSTGLGWSEGLLCSTVEMAQYSFLAASLFRFVAICTHSLSNHLKKMGKLIMKLF